jgi:hypothetical protein
MAAPRDCYAEAAPMTFDQFFDSPFARRATLGDVAVILREVDRCGGPEAFKALHMNRPFAHADAVRERLTGLVERNATREKVTVRRADLARLLRDTSQQAATDASAFVVVAGRWDDGERNTKLISAPMTLDAALVEYAGCSCYPWRHIEYKGQRLELVD